MTIERKDYDNSILRELTKYIIDFDLIDIDLLIGLNEEQINLFIREILIEIQEGMDRDASRENMPGMWEII